MGAAQLLTVEAAAERMSIDKMTVYRAIWAGDLGWVNLGQPGKRPRIRLRECDLDAFLANRLVPGGAA